MDIQIKFPCNGDETTENLPYEEFKHRISNGEIGSSVKVRDNILTNNEWITVDNLKIFHKLTDNRYPLGEIPPMVLEKIREAARNIGLNGPQAAEAVWHLRNISDYAPEFQQNTLCVSIEESFEDSSFFLLDLRDMTLSLNGNRLPDFSASQKREMESLINDIGAQNLSFSEDYYGLDGYYVFFSIYRNEKKSLTRWCPDHAAESRGLAKLNLLIDRFFIQAGMKTLAERY